MEDRTLIQKYATGIVKGFIEQVGSIGDLEHPFVKGRLRELFVSNILDRYLTTQFGVGSGIIINQRGVQSSETDIIIYDNRILPPFIREVGVGVFPIEAVVATIEVKSWLSLDELIGAEEAARQLNEIAMTGTIDEVKKRPSPPRTTVIGFFDNGVGKLKEENSGRNWIQEHLACIWGVCLAGSFSWLHLQDGWAPLFVDEYGEETKRYIAMLLDNVRTQAERNYRLIVEHHDWIGVYTRDNPTVIRFLNG